MWVCIGACGSVQCCAGATGHVPPAAGQVYKQMAEFMYSGLSVDRYLRSVGVTRRIHRAWACFGRYMMEIFDRPSVRSRLKMRMLRTEVMETLLYRCCHVEPEQG